MNVVADGSNLCLESHFEHFVGLIERRNINLIRVNLTYKVEHFVGLIERRNINLIRVNLTYKLGLSFYR